MCLVHVVPVVPPLPPDPNFVFEVPEYARALAADAERKLGELVGRQIPKGLEVRIVMWP